MKDRGERLGACKASARRSTDDLCRARTSKFRIGKTSPGARASKLSEPMWTASLELHTGHVAEGHDQRPDTRPIEVPACRDPLEESPCKTGGIHTRPASSCSADLEASLGEVDRQNMDVGHALLLRTRLEGARWHLTMPAGGGIHPISSEMLSTSALPLLTAASASGVGGSVPTS